MQQMKHTDLNDLLSLKAELAELDVDNKLFPIGMQVCRVGKDTLLELPELLRKIAKGGNRILMVTGPTYMVRDGKDLKKMVEQMLIDNGFKVRRLILTGEPTVHADEETVAKVKAELYDLDCVLVVGSGTVTDVCKDATYQVDKTIPIFCVQTACSVNAMSDNMAVVLRNGVKRTVPSLWVNGLIIDTQVIRDSPPEMSVAGFCDLMAQYCGPADYRLMNRVGMSDFYSELPHSLAGEAAQKMLDTSDGIIHGNEDSLVALATALTLWGFGMGIVDSTACLSGTEHVIGHLLDMDAGSKKQPNALHGAQVAVASIISAAIWQKVFDELDPAAVDLDRCYPTHEQVRPMVLDAFARVDPTGKMGEECWKDYEKKLTRWHANKDTFKNFLDNWNEEKKALRSFVRPPEEIAQAMHGARAPMKFSELDPPKDAETVRWAIYNCHLMRNRFNVIDLCFYLGWWNEEMMEEMLTVAASVGGGL